MSSLYSRNIINKYEQQHFINIKLNKKYISYIRSIYNNIYTFFFRPF